MAELIPVEEYLRSSYKPACDYIDGVLRQKALPNYRHSKMQQRVIVLVERFGDFDGALELTVRMREHKYLVPDVAVQRVSELQQPYPTKPVHLCIEILSPEDRFSDVLAKCEEYHAWGVKFCWIIDPEEKQCWEYEAGSRPHQVSGDEQLRADEIGLSTRDLFANF